MKLAFYRWLAVAALFLAPTGAWAQHDKPAIVVSISSIGETLSDIAYLTKAAGSPDVGKTVALFGGAYTQGIDKTRPIGIFVSATGDDEFQSVGCIPMKDLKKTLENFKDQLGEPRDAGEGILEVGTDQTFYIKEVGTWAYIGQQFSHLQKVPADPAKLLGDLPTKYNVAVQVNVRNIPEYLRTWAVTEMRNGFEQAADRNFDGGDNAAELQRQLGEAQLESMTRMIDEADQFTVGLAVDPQSKVTYMDVSLTAVEGSTLAKELADFTSIKSSFGGFVQPDGAMALHFSGPIGESDAKQVKDMIAEGKTKALKEIDNDPNLDGKNRGIAKEVLDSLFSVLVSTVDDGKLDGGALVLLDEKSIDFAAGIHVADGAKVESAFRKLVDLAKNDPEFPSVKLDAMKYAGITFHKLTANVPESENDARELFGETIDVYLGTGAKSVYFAVGKKSEALLKRIIDQSTSVADQQVPPMRLSFALLPFLKFAQSMDENADVAEMISTLQQNVDAGDKIRVTSMSIPRGTQARVEIDEGILKLIGVGAKKAGLQIPNPN